jgi:hypothetical protein
MLPAAIRDVVQRANWSERLPADQKRLYLRILGEARRRGLRFAIGGGLANIAYSGVWRNTRDLDLFVLPRDRDKFVALLTEQGMTDYHDRQAYDRSWIYRGFLEDEIIDVIWQMANHRAAVDDIWLDAGPSVEIDGEYFPLIPIEETLWTKLYVMQRERCDWPDGLNLIAAVGPEIDWDRLIGRIGVDAPLLAAILTAFAWVCPRRSLDLPPWLWDRLGARRSEGTESRAHFLDSRPWLTNLC